MKHFMLKFNHGVEIGAANAYDGHAKRTKDPEIVCITLDEMMHQCHLEEMLSYFNQTPNKIIDKTFKLIGRAVAMLCRVAPLSMLDFVARTLEVFAVFSYTRLAMYYPEFSATLIEMANTEEEHRRYFDN